MEAIEARSKLLAASCPNLLATAQPHASSSCSPSHRGPKGLPQATRSNGWNLAVVEAIMFDCSRVAKVTVCCNTCFLAFPSHKLCASALKARSFDVVATPPASVTDPTIPMDH